MTFALDLKMSNKGPTIRTKITLGERRDEKATLNDVIRQELRDAIKNKVTFGLQSIGGKKLTSDDVIAENNYVRQK